MKRLLCLLLSFLALGASAAPFATRDNVLLDPAGSPFIVRGFNRTHYDNWGTPADAQRIGANAVRIVYNFTKPEASNLALAQSYVAAGIVPIPGNWTGTCKADPALLSAIVDTWVAQAATWTQLNHTGLVNIANEWGPSSWMQQPVKPWARLPVYTWRDAYVAAVPRMRDAGYTGTLVIDAPACGQDANAVVRDGAAIIAADPLKNILFDLHVYGGWHLATPTSPTLSWQQDYDKAMQALKASGLPIMLGEFGPGRNIGPSPTMISPTKIIRDAEANGWGWMAWSVDDNNLANCTADDNWFSMTRKCGTYSGAASDLTIFGTQIVPLLQVLARPASM
jgi:mannan endo-1,4-beta-mannosidase